LNQQERSKEPHVAGQQTSFNDGVLDVRMAYLYFRKLRLSSKGNKKATLRAHNGTSG